MDNSAPSCSTTQETSTHLQNFKSWFSNILDGLSTNENAGLAVLMITFPLLERYLREKSGVHENKLTKAFYTELRQVFPALKNDSVARHFWKVYRNGLLHQVTFSHGSGNLRLPDGWLSGGVDMVRVDASGDFSVNPAKFAKRVVEVIEAGFAIFQGTHSVNHPLLVINAKAHTTGSAAFSQSPPLTKLP